MLLIHTHNNYPRRRERFRVTMLKSQLLVPSPPLCLTESAGCGRFPTLDDIPAALKSMITGPRPAGKRPGVSEQRAKELQEKRKPLLAHFKEAKKQGKRARFVGPKLLVQGHFVTTGIPSHHE